MASWQVDFPERVSVILLCLGLSAQALAIPPVSTTAPSSDVGPSVEFVRSVIIEISGKLDAATEVVSAARLGVQDAFTANEVIASRRRDLASLLERMDAGKVDPLLAYESAVWAGDLWPEVERRLGRPSFVEIVRSKLITTRKKVNNRERYLNITDVISVGFARIKTTWEQKQQYARVVQASADEFEKLVAKGLAKNDNQQFEIGKQESEALTRRFQNQVEAILTPLQWSQMLQEAGAEAKRWKLE